MKRVDMNILRFHYNDALREEFYRVVEDLRDAACIVDLWLIDIASVLERHGYEMQIWEKASPVNGDGMNSGAG